jgi:serine/threonine-protein kinase
MEQVYIPEGEFTMGSEDPYAIRTTENGRAYPEIPVHTVYLGGYWFDKYEVTNRQYALCVEAGACAPPFTASTFTRDSYYGNPEFADYPVVWVKWPMARAYCEWAGRRLPTEAEWEKAARGTDERIYTWGNETVSGDRANLCDVNCPKEWANANFDDGYPDTAPVGSYPAGASPYGVMDMAGNVWEWTSSLIEPYPYDPEDGREDLEAPGERAWRSGAWNDGYWWMRVSVRYRSVTFYWYYNLGIRCAATP